MAESTPSSGSLPSVRSDGHEAAFCRFDSDIDKAANAANTPSQRLGVLRSFDPRFDQALADAPSAIKRFAVTMVTASRAAIRANDLRAASTDAVASAGYQLDRYCGIAVPPK